MTKNELHNEYMTEILEEIGVKLSTNNINKLVELYDNAIDFEHEMDCYGHIYYKK